MPLVAVLDAVDCAVLELSGLELSGGFAAASDALAPLSIASESLSC